MRSELVRARGAAAAWAALVAVGWSPRAEALSLRVSRASAFLGEARPGRSFPEDREAGAFVVENAGADGARLEASAASSPRSSLADGYDPLPDLRWAAVEPRKAELPPGGAARAAARVRVPARPGLTGGQYQFDCLFRGRSAGGSVLSMRTQVRLAVGPGDPPAPRGALPEGFVLSPSRGQREGVALGRKVAALPEGRPLKLANAGRGDLAVRLSALREWPEEAVLPEGYERAPNPRWLLAPPEVRVKAGAVSPARLELLIPAQERYRGRRWAFLVAADAAEAAPAVRVGRAGSGRKAGGRALFVLAVETERELPKDARKEAVR